MKKLLNTKITTTLFDSMRLSKLMLIFYSLFTGLITVLFLATAIPIASTHTDIKGITEIFLLPVGLGVLNIFVQFFYVTSIIPWATFLIFTIKFTLQKNKISFKNILTLFSYPIVISYFVSFFTLILNISLCDYSCRDNEPFSGVAVFVFIFFGQIFFMPIIFFLLNRTTIFTVNKINNKWKLIINY